MPSTVEAEASLPMDSNTNTDEDPMEMDEIAIDNGDQHDEDEAAESDVEFEDRDEDELSVVSARILGDCNTDEDGSGVPFEGDDCVQFTLEDEDRGGVPLPTQLDPAFIDPTTLDPTTIDPVRLDPAHWHNMIWNETLKKFEYDKNITADADEVPKVHEWRKVPPRDMKKVHVSFSGGRETLMSHYIEEYKCFHNRLEDLKIGKTQCGVFEYVYGENSLLSGAMTRVLNVSYKELCQFLATVYFAAEFRTAASRLEDHAKVKYDGYMPKERYNEIWNMIKVAGKDGRSAKLWEEVQEALNKMCRELFLSDEFRPSKMRIALDDDKVHLHFSTKSVRKDKHFLLGMKACQHVEANCRGFTIDSAVASASGFPYHFSVLKATESNTDNYKRMLMFMFNHIFTSGDPIPLSGIIFCSDRGYWNVLLMLCLLSWGAYIFGTLKRAWWVPYTYDQKKLYGRESIDAKYGHSCFQAFCRMSNYLVKIMAFRSGTGAVSLAMNSDISEDKEPQTFDFCVKNNSDLVWYKSDMPQNKRELMAFPAGEVTSLTHDPPSLMRKIEHHLKLLTANTVKMLTISDLDQCWFALRKFAWTSSSVHQAFRYSSSLIDPEDPVHSSFTSVLEFAGLSSLLSEQSTNANDNEDNSNDSRENDVITAEFVQSTMQLIRAEANDSNALQQCSRDLQQFEQQLSNEVAISKVRKQTAGALQLILPWHRPVDFHIISQS